jgi:hypothetical protein
MKDVLHRDRTGARVKFFYLTDLMKLTEVGAYENPFLPAELDSGIFLYVGIGG